VDLRGSLRSIRLEVDEYPLSSSTSVTNSKGDSGFNDDLFVPFFSTPPPTKKSKRNDPKVLSTTIPEILSSD